MPTILKASILIATTTAIGVSVLAVGNPMTLFADVTASLVDNSRLQPSIDHSTPTIQSIADSQALPPSANDTPTRDEIVASEPAGQDQKETSEPSSEALFKQFQAWSAENDAQATVETVEPVQDAPARVVQSAPPQIAENARVPLRLMQKHRQVRTVHSARAEIRMQNSRKLAQPARSARAPARPVQNARAQDQSVQNAPSSQQTTQHLQKSE